MVCYVAGGVVLFALLMCVIPFCFAYDTLVIMLKFCILYLLVIISFGGYD